MDVYYLRFSVFVFSLKSRKIITENSDVICATVVIATTYLKLLEKENMLFFLLIIFIFCVFSLIIYFTLKKNVTDSFEIINEQFNFFSSKILILPTKEKDELRGKFIVTPSKKVDETLGILKWILLGLNILIIIIFIMIVFQKSNLDSVPQVLKIIISLLNNLGF